ncbi:MAG: hypothetical protein ACRDRX_04520 [Pseudonocardiaceae bacterium]
MSELREPTRLRADWDVHDLELRVESSLGDTAAKLGTAITAAAQWTPDPVVDAEIIDPAGCDYDLLRNGVLEVAPAWMADAAVSEFADRLLVWLSNWVTVIRHGKAWHPTLSLEVRS